MKYMDRYFKEHDEIIASSMLLFFGKKSCTRITFSNVVQAKTKRITPRGKAFNKIVRNSLATL